MKIQPIVASTFRADGGAMFGLVPRPIWSKKIPPDDSNRIPQNANALLITLDDGRIGLVDTGCGSPDHYTERERSIQELGSPWPLLAELGNLNLRPEDIDFVILTHLHWDHAGGSIQPPSQNPSKLTFQKATYYVHAKEWEDATSRNPLFYKAYPESLIQPLENAKKSFQFIEEEEKELFPGIRLIRSGGHTRGHMIVLLEKMPTMTLDRKTSQPPYALFAGDECPTSHHLRLVFQTAYDMYPLNTRAWKQTWLPKLADDQGLLLFDHDPELFGATIQRDEKQAYRVGNALSCNDENARHV